MKKNKELLFCGKLFFLSYIFNFLWESIHAYLFYAGHQVYTAGFYFRMVAYAATMDALLIILLYFIVALLLRNIFWDKKEGYLLFFLFGLVVAAVIEYHAVFLAGKWSYNAYMPTIFGIGLSPLIQLSLTGLLSLLILKKESLLG